MTLAREVARVFAPLLGAARYKGAWGGRGSGKSHFFAEQLIALSIAERIDAVCIREVQKSLKQSVKKLLEQKIQTMGVSEHFEVLETEIRSVLGGVIIFEGMQNHTSDSIKSLEGYDVAWVEEAQSLSQRSLDLLRPTIRKEGSELWFSWNPRDKSDPVDVLLRGDQVPPDAIVVRANYSDNPWLPDVLLKEMEDDRRRDKAKFAHVWLGEYLTLGDAQVFHNWTVEEFERPKGTTFRLGADWGYSNDPSCLVRASIEGRRLYVDYEAYMVGCEIDQLPDLFDGVPESRKWFITADSARPETISYLKKRGYPRINAAIKGAKSIEEGVAFLQSYDIVVHPRCKNLIEELAKYRYKVDEKTDKVLPVLEDKHNNCIDALRYACEGVRRAEAEKRPQVRTKPWTPGVAGMGL